MFVKYKTNTPLQIGHNVYWKWWKKKNHSNCMDFEGLVLKAIRINHGENGTTVVDCKYIDICDKDSLAKNIY